MNISRTTVNLAVHVTQFGFDKLLLLLRLQGLKVIDLQMSDYMRHVEQAVQFGTPLLLQNIMDKLDASLDPVLNKSVIYVGSSLCVVDFCSAPREGLVRGN